MADFIEIHLHNIETGESFVVVVNEMADIVQIPRSMLDCYFESEAHHLEKEVKRYKHILYKAVPRTYLPDKDVWDENELLKVSLRYK